MARFDRVTSDPTTTPHAPAQDPSGFLDAARARQEQDGGTLRDAMSAIARERPALHRAHLAASRGVRLEENRRVRAEEARALPVAPIGQLRTLEQARALAAEHGVTTTAALQAISRARREA
jgi:hypothetical protein